MRWPHPPHVASAVLAGWLALIAPRASFASSADELVEVTPDAIRVRKQILSTNKRPRRADAIEDAQSVG